MKFAALHFKLDSALNDMRRALYYLLALPIALTLLALPGRPLAWSAAAVLSVALFSFLIYGYVSNKRVKREKHAGTYASRFVQIERDGSVRELTSEEVDYLNTEFHPADGARPYIKSRYAQLTPDGRIDGFLPRKKLPQGLRSINRAVNRASTDA